MIIGGFMAQNDIIGAAMQARVVRDRMHVHNIANNDTPGFKRFEVAFEESLRRAVNDYRRTGTLDLSRAQPEVRRTRTNMWNRVDGNNVDINEENALLFINSALYDALTSSIITNYRQLNSVFNNMRPT